VVDGIKKTQKLGFGDLLKKQTLVGTGLDIYTQKVMAILGIIAKLLRHTDFLMNYILEKYQKDC
jgi:hypothetical protein